MLTLCGAAVAPGQIGEETLPVTITLRFFDRQVPEWLAGENMRDQDGNTHFGYSGFPGRRAQGGIASREMMPGDRINW